LGIVIAHDGVFTVESEIRRGSTFQVFIPVSVEEVTPQLIQKTTLAPAVETGGTVLLVEDDEMVRAMAEKTLMRFGFTVLTAKDGVEAVDTFSKLQHKIHVVLCDLNMPRMNGWETLAALRLISPGVPVVIASGYDESTVFAEDHLERPQAFLHKPYQRSKLLESLTKAMAGNAGK
jgi:two-component system cell cycle sensor histidine kinase/response regulator CckA